MKFHKQFVVLDDIERFTEIDINNSSLTSILSITSPVIQWLEKIFFTNFLCIFVAYALGSVLFLWGDAIPRRMGNFGVFFPNDNA